MPLPKERKALTRAETFDDLRHGRTFKRTARKHGRRRARKQMIMSATLASERATSAGHKIDIIHAVEENGINGHHEEEP